MKKSFLNEQGFVTKQRPVLSKSSLAILQRSIKPVDWFTIAELELVHTGDMFVFDTECYVNFWYCAFKHIKTGKVFAVEQSPACELDRTRLLWALWRFNIVGFNSRNYDLPMIALAATGVSNAKLKEASDFIIKQQQLPFAFEKHYGVKIGNYNHIDLIEVAPLQGSLKLYTARLHCERMQDLPFDDMHILTAEDAAIVRPYCCNDLDNTQLLLTELSAEVKLRVEMSQRYDVDLRSKSDAQLAEAVINSELNKVLGYFPKKPTLADDEVLQYVLPPFVSFKSKQLQDVLQVILDAQFYLDGVGSPIMPQALEKLTVTIGGTVYKLGMGGLHSMEKCVAHIATDEIVLKDIDVESFYPRIILNQKLFPKHLTEAFLQVYKVIVDTRIDAKAKAKTNPVFKVTADSLKIVINGSFGKFGNRYSTLYAPQLMLQVTITGQLVLLMLIEMLQSIGIDVVSGNTDGIILKYHKSRQGEVSQTVAMWEQITAFKTEETNYSALYNRDVNNYIAVKLKGDEKGKFLDEKLGCKTKGVYSERGSALNSILSKNPETLICIDAVLQYIKNGIPIEKTIMECRDIKRFVAVKNVKGGGEKNGIYLGKVVRWYYPMNEAGCISYVLSGNKVPKTDGAQPLMDLPSEFPNNINYQWYIQEATDMLYECGCLQLAKSGSLF